MFSEVMLSSITCSLILSLRLYLTLDEIKEILSPFFVLGSLFCFCRLALVRMLPRLSRVTRMRPKYKAFMGVARKERSDRSDVRRKSDRKNYYYFSSTYTTFDFTIPSS